MARQLLVLMTLLFSMTLLGCGGSGSPEVNTTKDELAKWNEANPAPPIEGEEDL